MPKPSVWVSDSVVAMVVKHPGNRHSESPIAWNRNYLITNGSNPHREHSTYVLYDDLDPPAKQ